MRVAGGTFLGLGVLVALWASWTVPLGQSWSGNMGGLVLGAVFAMFGLLIMAVSKR